MKTNQLGLNDFFESGKRAVLLLHAYTGTPNDVRMTARFLEANHYTVLTPLFKGHGTMQPEDILTVAPSMWTVDVENSIAFLKEKGYQEIAIFGLSMGGVFAMNQLCQADTSIIGGGSFCSPITAHSDHQILPNFMKYCERLFQKQQLTPEKIADRIDELTPQIAQQLEQIEQISREVYETLPSIQRKVFLAQAGQDELITASDVYRTAANLKQAELALHYYPEATHVITIGKERKKLEKHLLAFLDDLPWNEEK